MSEEDVIYDDPVLNGIADLIRAGIAERQRRKAETLNASRPQRLRVPERPVVVSEPYEDDLPF